MRNNIEDINYLPIEVLQSISDILFNSYYLNMIDDIVILTEEDVNSTLLKIGFKFNEYEIKIITEYINVLLFEYKNNYNMNKWK